MLGKQPVHKDSESRVKKRKGKTSLEEKTTTAIPNVQSTPVGDEEKKVIKETVFCMLASSLKSLAPEHSITVLILSAR